MQSYRFYSVIRNNILRFHFCYIVGALLHSFIQSKRHILIYDGKDLPSFGDIDFRLLETNGFTDLTGNLFDGHHPKESFALSHCCIHESRTDIGDDDVATSLESLLAQGFYVVDLVSFRCAISRCHRFATQPANRGGGYEVAVT